MWSFGNPHKPKENEPSFDSETEAIDAAIKASNEMDGEEILAVWHDGECTTLVWLGWVYSAT